MKYGQLIAANNSLFTFFEEIESYDSHLSMSYSILVCKPVGDDQHINAQMGVTWSHNDYYHIEEALCDSFEIMEANDPRLCAYGDGI